MKEEDSNNDVIVLKGTDILEKMALAIEAAEKENPRPHFSVTRFEDLPKAEQDRIIKVLIKEYGHNDI